MPKKAIAEFVRLGEDKVKPCSLKLKLARDIPHQCQIIVDQSNPLPVWQEQLSFKLGKISAEQFNYLQETYSGWSASQSAVVYEPNKSYQLIDFLPPLIQALNSHRFIPETTLQVMNISIISRSRSMMVFSLKKQARGKMCRSELLMKQL